MFFIGLEKNKLYLEMKWNLIYVYPVYIRFKLLHI